jgi:ABC-type multidrug transport system fused ATPase/permease subunit
MPACCLCCAVNVYNLFISVGLGSVAASLGELGKAVGALERIAELVVPTPSAADSATTAASSRSSSSDAEPSTSSHSSNGSSYGHGMVGTHAMETPASSSTNGSSAQVQFQNVSFKYPGVQDWAVKNLNLTLQQGQTVALVGPSGGGKSTIAALLLGLYHPQQGSILVSGVPLDRQVKENSSVAAVGMAAVLQQPMLMSGSVREQIRWVICCGCAAWDAAPVPACSPFCKLVPLG